MDITSQHPWHALLQTPLTPEQITQALSEDDPQWDAIDSQMVKLGSLTHSSLNIAELQLQVITLLAEKSKDFRLMVHLLRTLQHAGKPDELMLAVSLLSTYVRHFWDSAWPQNRQHKKRFAGQILKRFAGADSKFRMSASDVQRENMQGLLAHLAQVWHSLEPDLAQEVDDLRSGYARPPERLTATQEKAEAPATASAPPAVDTSPVLAIDRSSDKAWRQTLLQMADTLCEIQPDAAIGYRVRRYAVWGALTAPPVAQADGRTPLAAVASDRTADYLARIANADLTLWQQVEQSLTLAPYWLDGHVLSAQIALRLGYEQVAQAIREELRDFLTRIPALATLFFSDMTAFLSADSADWLQQKEEPAGGSSVIEQDEIWHCFQQQGLEAALHRLNTQPQQSDPREHFYRQLLGAQLMEKAGLASLAQQQYQSLLQLGQQMQLSTWEPSLIVLLTEKQRQLKT
ncbi:type VI secretion system protein TssA [Erwinia sorbitola]|uniref:Type VI secretion system protein TssA n=1 Tax=Erwinia sorbitola TaxID=2681984 RepID=A0A6I6F2L0_9GAMM|nr:type VI secretion system protein TssA [Erwinia sorbitola]QGU88110.1 type VI secretion system protein TssA [Erwinia sorbitola]